MINPVASSFVTNASLSPLRVAWTGIGETGKFEEMVVPVT